jgi:restriction endonuclease S subunit
MNWPVIKLRDLQQKKRSSLDPSKNSNEIFTLYSIPAYDMGEPQVLRGSEIGSSKQLVSNGDVLISKIVPHIRRAWVVDDSYGNRQIASGEWIVFNSEKILPQFFRQFLLSDVFHRKFMTTVAGVGGSLLRAQPRLVADFNFSLPPLAEQQRIAELLDTADRIFKQRESAIAKLDQLAKSVFVDMFGNPAKNSKGWSEKDFDEVVMDVTKDFKKIDSNNYLNEGKTPVIDQSAKYICGYTNLSPSFKEIIKPHIIFGDHTRRFKYVNFDFILGADGTKVLAPRITAIDLKYLFYFFQYLKIEEAGYSRHFKFLKRSKIFIPPQTLQLKFVEMVNEIELQKKKMHDWNIHNMQLVSSLQHQSFAVN